MPLYAIADVNIADVDGVSCLGLVDYYSRQIEANVLKSGSIFFV